MFALYFIHINYRNETTGEEKRDEEAASIVQESAEDWTEAEPGSICCVNQRVYQARVVGEAK